MKKKHKLNKKIIIGMIAIGAIMAFTPIIGYIVDNKEVQTEIESTTYTEDDLLGFQLNFQNLYCDLVQLFLNFQDDMNSTKYDFYIDPNGSDVPKMRAIGKKYQTIRESLNINTGIANLSKFVLKDEFSESIRLLNQSAGYLNGWIDGNAELSSFEEFKNSVVTNLESFSISIDFVVGAYTKELGYLLYDYPELDTKFTANFKDIEEICAITISMTKSDDLKNAASELIYDYPDTPLQFDTANYNDNVKKIQERLHYFGYDIAIDGYFGNQTKNAILAFQKQKELEIDGIVGPLTWNVLFENKTPQSAFISIPYTDNYSRAENGAYYIYGTTSDNCARITVQASNPDANIYDNYQLELYKPGDTTFKYGFKEEWNNLGIGNNTYTFTAYCEGNQIKTASGTLNYTVPVPAYSYPTVPSYNYPTTTKSTSNCDPNYSGCVPIASDVDCAGGSGNGPAYVRGPVRVIGRDIYGLDRDKDGWGCE